VKIEVCFMFPQTGGLRGFALGGSNFCAELRIFALRYRICVFVYGGGRNRLPSSMITFTVEHLNSQNIKIFHYPAKVLVV
jgi:hypothetical protein